MKVELQIGKLAEYIEEFNGITLADNQEVLVDDLDIYVPIVGDKTRVNYFIKKFNLPMICLTFSNGYTIQVAKKHILQQHNRDIFADSLEVGSVVDHITGPIYVMDIHETENQNCFDVAIAEPHIYHDCNGLFHHNTITTAALSYSVQEYGRSIVIVPNKSLVVQTEEDYRNVGLDVGVYFGDQKELGKKHTICTWQSLNNLLKNTQSGDAEVSTGEFIEDVVCVMVDECHMAKADVIKTLMTGVFSHVPIRWGLTGTIPKAEYDAISIYVSLGHVVGKLSASELQDKGVLAQCHVNIIQFQDNVEFSNYQSELKYLTEDGVRLDAIAGLINKIKATGNTLVLVDRIGAGKELTSRINNAVFVSGETKLTERKEEYDEVAEATNKILVCTYGVAAVGINVPRLFNVVLIEPGKSFVRVIQSIGRGLRKASDKDFVQIWDITSTCKFSKRHLSQRKQYYKDAQYPFEIEKLSYR